MSRWFLAVLLTVAVTMPTQAENQPNIVELKVPPPTVTQEMRDAFEYGAAPSAALLGTIMQNRSSLFEPQTPPDLVVELRGSEIVYSTDALYYTASPKCAGDPLDFDIATTANFGLRGYVINGDNCKAFEVGEYNTAYYSVAVDEALGYMAFAVPGVARIDIYRLTDFTLLRRLEGYSATTVQFHDGSLYFAGTPAGGAWDAASIFQYDFETNAVLNEYLVGELADVRGLAFQGGTAAISNGAKHQVLIADDANFSIRTVITGLNYPNGVSFAPNGDLLVADEHNALIHRLNANYKIVWSSPPFELISPASAVEISRGAYKGALLIADADGNRAIVVKPETWEVLYEVIGLRSVLSAVPIYDGATRAFLREHAPIP